MSTEIVAKRALLIGIGSYPHLPPQRQLRGPAPDVQALAALLTSRYGFQSATLLTDGQATRDGILKAFADFEAEVNPGDLVLIHYSGHGSRTPDVHGDDASGWDSTWVPHDGRDPEGLVRDLLDAEVNHFFDRLLHERHAADLILFFDSCHSTGMTRIDMPDPYPKRGRSLEPPPAAARLTETAAADAASPPPTWQPTGHEHVAFFACQNDETAYEVTLAADTVHGALTEALLAALRSGEMRSYRDVWESVLLQVGKTSPSQRPQVEGHLDRTLFGLEPVEQMFYAPVLGVTPRGLVQLGAGSALGLEEGDRLRLAPPGTRRLSQAGVGTLVEIAAGGLEPHRALATVVSGTGGQAGQWAFLETIAPTRHLTVNVQPAAGNERLITKLKEQPALRLLETGAEAEAEVTIVVEDGHVHLRDSHGQPLLPPVLQRGFTWSAAVVAAATKLAWRRIILRLANPGSALAGALRLTVEQLHAAGHYEPLAPSSQQQWRLTAGATLRLSFDNVGPADLFAAVLTVETGADPVQLWPPGAGAALTVAPGKRIVAPLAAPRAPLVVKAIAATRPIPTDLLLQPATRRTSETPMNALAHVLLEKQHIPLPAAPADHDAASDAGRTRIVSQPTSREKPDDWFTYQALLTPTP